MADFGTLAGIGHPEESVEQRPPIAGPELEKRKYPVTLPGIVPRGTSQLSTDQAEVGRLQSTGSGISQLQKSHPVIGGILKGLDIAGSILAPQAAAAIPGTEFHHQALLEQARGNVGQDIQEQERQTQTEHTQAETEALQHPAAKQEEAGHTITTDKGIMQWNPETQRYDIPAGGAPGKQEEAGKTITTDQGVMQWNPSTQRYDIRAGGPAPKDNAAAEDERYRKIIAAARLGHLVPREDAAWAKAYEKGKTLGPTTTAELNAPAKADARLDKSYTYNNKQLEDQAKSVDTKVEKLDTALTNVHMGTAAADALVAPELLSVMAGGQGSGLRMNEAEISRITHGRSTVEDIKAWGQKLANGKSITPEQRKQITDILQEAGRKAAAKQKLIQESREGLLNAESVEEHRRIMSHTKKSLEDLDSAGVGGTGTGGGMPPPGSTVRDYTTLVPKGPK
jgi:hypothetical protein